jgi:hypothetical protein
MSIFTKIWGGIKQLLPFLMDAAEKAYYTLPNDQQEAIKRASIIAQVVKHGFENKTPVEQIIVNLLQQLNVTRDTLNDIFTTYWQQKGQDVSGTTEGIQLLLADASLRTETGLKSLWNGFVNVVSTVVANVDWSVLLLGVVEFVYKRFVKGVVK